MEPDLSQALSDPERRSSVAAPRLRVLRAPWTPFVLLGLCALAVGLSVWAPLPPGIWHDDGAYLLIGQSLAEGHGLRYAGVPGTPPAPKFPPVYPTVTAFAWLMGGDGPGAAVVAALLNVLFLATAIATAAAFGRHVLKLPLALALGAGGLLALSVDLWRPALVALSEPLYVLVLVCALFAAARAERGERWQAAVPLVLVLALLIHVRTAGVAVAAAAVLGLALAHRIRRAAGVAAAVGVLSLPWIVWSARAGAAIPGPLRDILGTYGSWLGGQVREAPLRFVATLPPAAAGVGGRTLALLLPGIPTWGWWVLGPLLALALLMGAVAMGRRSPTAPLALGLSLVMAWLWPFQDRRLLLPVLPLLVLALALAAARLLEPASAGAGRVIRPVALGALTLWAMAFAAVSGSRLARDWAVAGYEIRGRALAEAAEAIRGRVPLEGVVGAPELWPAIPLVTGRRAAPSARFRTVTGEGGPVWGSPEEQLALWAAAGIDHVLLEQGGVVHGETLNLLEESCPGSVRILDRTGGRLLVRLDWDAACRQRLLP